MGFTHNLGTLAQGVFSDSSLNIGIGGAPSGSFKFEVTGTGRFSGALTGTSATFANTTALGVATQTTAGLYNGVAASASGSSFFTKTGSLSSSFSSGFAVDGTYSGGLSLINLRAIGTQTAGGYASSMVFILDNDGVQRNHAIFSSDGSTTLYGALSGTSATFTGTSGASSTRLTLQGTGNGWNNQYITNTGGALWLGVMRDDGIAPFTGGTAFAGYIGTSNSTNFIITTAAIPRLTATSGGNVLIGTTTDAGYKLDVNAGGGSVRFNGTIGDKLVLYNSGNNSGTNGIYIDSDIYPAIRFNNRVAFAGTAKIVYNTYATGYGAASLNGSFIMQGPNALQFSSGGDNVRLTIASTGESTFSGSLTMSAYSYASSAIQFTRAASNLVQPASGNGILVFAGGNAQMRMDTANQICFDMNDGGTPHTVLQLNQNQNTVFINSPNNTLQLGFRYQGTAYGYYGATPGFSGGAALAYSVNGGYVYLSSGSTWIGASDRNIKKNFEPYNKGLEAICGLEPTLYNLKIQQDSEPKLVGLIAQEVNNYIPEAYSEEGDFIGLNYNAIIVTMINAIKELNAKITQLENK
jgi:hypothetical protein